MAKFNKTTTRPAATSPVTTESAPTGHTHEGAPGYLRDAKSELFLLAVSNMVGEATFYEPAATRDNRYRDLVHAVAVDDPMWITGFLTWLRSGANMRSASLVGGLEAAKALKDAGIAGGRKIVDSVLQRADEPGEALAYWTGTHGRAIPKPVKRGIADAVTRLYTEYSLLKYDTASKGFRFGDVIDLTHPATDRPWQGELFRHALDRRHGRDNPVNLDMVNANAALRGEAVDNSEVLFDTDRLRTAGMTWEDALSLAGPDVDKARLWEAMIPSMGYMALLRNLRNFDEAGVGDTVAETVAERLADPDQISRSRQLPFRFLSAYQAAPSLRWGHALEKALDVAVANVPGLPGRTLVLVDTSASMCTSVSHRSTVTAAQAAALFGAVLAKRGGQVDLHGFADSAFRHDFPAGASVLRTIGTFIARIGEVGHGTRIADAVASTYDGHDRVIILSDMQTMTGWNGTVSDQVPAHIPMYGWNLIGYRHGAIASGRRNRHEFGGFSDAAFRLIPLLEAGRNADWPWID
ncbi:TROVE domain-containing protein [Stackebrandtia endophytica]|uniref:TROVE domain-containing protein n=1 Tax=Stackebrandtia endophytica TaxID=1496996 RepID=A0A543B2I1_9ACTN|nr:TROVE domain-containing protein [Stackebrandtia endophytica]TQL79031.1 TROVE domain-containing protein [Stackebrandtia endophytica]